MLLAVPFIILDAADKSLVFIDQLGFVYNLDATKISVTRGTGDPLSKYFLIQYGISFHI